MSRALVEATCFEPRQLPAPDVPEVIMAGRSNVGKSSLINALLGAKLAHVGGTPGKTRSVNFYRVESDGAAYRVVDLPGYGYASRSKSERNEWLRLVSAYMDSRAVGSMASSAAGQKLLACHLVDFRHGLLANDRELQDWLNQCGAPMLVVFTKADKIPRGKWRGMLEQYVRDGLYSIDVPIITSAEKRAGTDALNGFIVKFLFER